MNWIKALLIGGIFTLAFQAHAQKPKSYPVVTQELAAKIIAALHPNCRKAWQWFRLRLLLLRSNQKRLANT